MLCFFTFSLEKNYLSYVKISSIFIKHTLTNAFQGFFKSKETSVRFILHRIGETERNSEICKCPKYDQPDCEEGIWKIMVHRPGVSEDESQNRQVAGLGCSAG